MSLKVRFHIDGHVHLYPQYNLAQALENGLRNLKSQSPKASNHALIGEEGDSRNVIPLLLLAEHSDCDFFGNSRKSNSTFLENGFRLLPADEKETITVEQAGSPVLYILAGRQIVTKEGLEILSLTSTLFLPDRERSIDEVIKAVNESGGVAVLNWAPGKWFFSRGKTVERILEEYSPLDVLLGDTILRHTFWPVPKLMRAAKNRGFKVIAGSDPLPFKGEEKYVGSYGFLLEAGFDANRPADSLRSLLKQPQISILTMGRRNDVITFLARQSKIMIEKKKRG